MSSMSWDLKLQTELPSPQAVLTSSTRWGLCNCSSAGPECKAGSSVHVPELSHRGRPVLPPAKEFQQDFLGSDAF